MVFTFQARDNRDARCIPGWFLRRARHWTGVRNLRSARWYKATSWPQARSASGSFSAALPSGKHQPCTAWGRLRFPRASSPQRTPPGGFLHHWSRLGSGNTRNVGYRCSHGILAAITLLNSKRFWTGAPSLEGGISQRLSLNMTELPQFSSSEEEWRSELG